MAGRKRHSAGDIEGKTAPREISAGGKTGEEIGLFRKWSAGEGDRNRSAVAVSVS
jgi:hypothetical protein